MCLDVRHQPHAGRNSRRANGAHLVDEVLVDTCRECLQGLEALGGRGRVRVRVRFRVKFRAREGLDMAPVWVIQAGPPKT